MLEFVEKLTKFPWLLVETDVSMLRQAGFSDGEILHIVLGSAHFNYLNRMADGIGIKFEYKTDIPAFKLPQSNSKAPRYLTSTAQASAENQPSRSTIAWIDFPAQQDTDHPGEGLQNLLRVMGGNPEARDLAREWRAYQLKATPHLDTRRRARIALFISGLNHCDYGIRSYRRELLRMGEDQTTLDLLSNGKEPDQVSSSEKLVYEHSSRLTREPWTIKEEHIQQLRRAGMDDKAVLQLTMLASYLSFENRVALGLGISLDQ
jgi:AhpD family alkylhydroperoxidase